MNFVDCESYLEENSPDMLALCETNLDDSIDFGNFSVGGYLPLIQKDSSTQANFKKLFVFYNLHHKEISCLGSQ